MLDLNKPILIFYANLLYHGVTVAVVDGRLRIGGDTTKLSPAYRTEIQRRAEHLIKLLSPPVPDELAPYFGRLFRAGDCPNVLAIAERLDVDVRLTPADGGWIMTMGDGSQLPSTRREQRKAARRKEAVGAR